MTDQRQRLADLLIDAQGALIELEGRLPGENEDVAECGVRGRERHGR